jgi:hypothetical protein
MLKYRKNVPERMKKALFQEAGDKCANPGCTNYRTHIHHIKEWAVYQTHDEKHMIAICPSCHDSVRYGTLKIDDETLYRWKSIPRKQTKRDHIYVEPDSSPKLLLGSISVCTKFEGKVFNLSPNNQLSFHTIDDDIFLVNLRISNIHGHELFRIVENHVKHEIKAPLIYSRRPGKIRVTSPISNDFLPDEALNSVRYYEPDYARDGLITIIDVEVLKPGLVRVQGIWIERDKEIVITQKQIVFLRPGMSRSLTGEGEKTVFNWQGPIDKTMFGFKNKKK